MNHKLNHKMNKFHESRSNASKSSGKRTKVLQINSTNEITLKLDALSVTEPGHEPRTTTVADVCRSESWRLMNLRPKKEADFNHVFLVFEYPDQDLSDVFKSCYNGTQVNKTHILAILYNALNAVDFLHQ